MPSTKPIIPDFLPEDLTPEQPTMHERREEPGKRARRPRQMRVEDPRHEEAQRSQSRRVSALTVAVILLGLMTMGFSLKVFVRPDGSLDESMAVLRNPRASQQQRRVAAQNLRASLHESGKLIARHDPEHLATHLKVMLRDIKQRTEGQAPLVSALNATWNKTR